jgi:hypothetical protein
LYVGRQVGHRAFTGSMADMFGVRSLDFADRFKSVSATK